MLIKSKMLCSQYATKANMFTLNLKKAAESCGKSTRQRGSCAWSLSAYSVITVCQLISSEIMMITEENNKPVYMVV